MKEVKNKIRGTLLGIAVILCFAQGVKAQDLPLPNDYIITGSAGAFTASLRTTGLVIGAPDQPIQTVIDAVRADAAGNGCHIQFGSGTAPLDIGGNTITFDGCGWMGWGPITLTGRVTSSSPASVINLLCASINSWADVTNTYTEGHGSAAIRNTSAGTLTISGGSVSGSYTAVYNESAGAVIIRGGRVLAREGRAVYNTGTGAVTLTEEGVVFAYGTNAGDVIYGDYTQTEGLLSMIIAWNQAAGNTSYTHLSSTDLFVRINPDHRPLASANWVLNIELLPGGSRESHGIAYALGSNTGFIEIEGVTTSSTSVLASSLVNVNSLSPVISVRGRTLNVRIPASQQSSPALQIHMIDMRGRTVSNFNISGDINNSFQLTKIPAGRYIAEVKNAGKRMSSTPVTVR
ncbi:MAG: hypothetical protein FWE57_08105 [Chitinispirillia bacterium]|nr:hypothetical protein [Chitinispirillia bacterium]